MNRFSIRLFACSNVAVKYNGSPSGKRVGAKSICLKNMGHAAKSLVPIRVQLPAADTIKIMNVTDCDHMRFILFYC